MDIDEIQLLGLVPYRKVSNNTVELQTLREYTSCAFHSCLHVSLKFNRVKQIDEHKNSNVNTRISK